MRLAFTVALSVFALACGRNQPSNSNEQSPEGLTQAQAWSEAQGFAVHEWGTLTSVVASDGSLLPGMHHEEEDLPGFVADRMTQANANPDLVVTEKMETPVTYFYSATPISVSAKVGFPNGIFTQWYPFVKSMSPPLLHSFTTNSSVDPYVMLSDCPYFQTLNAFPLKDGRLDWGQFLVLGPGEKRELPGPLGHTTWGFARNVASNALQIGEQNEKFLFYRGLGDFQLPVTATVAGDVVWLSNGLRGRADSVTAAFLIQVTKTGAGFVELGAIGSGEVSSKQIPAATMPLPDFVDALKLKLKAVLVADGLYSDEAQAMVDTWERSYFLTPGIRALYLLPQSVTDEVIPLEISPQPRQLKRTMVIRLELLTPDYESRLAQWLHELTQAPTARAAEGKFLGLGRFAEPHLTRAVRNSHDKDERMAGELLLRQIRAQRKWAPTAVE
jgi:hypothetical protein